MERARNCPDGKRDWSGILRSHPPPVHDGKVILDAKRVASVMANTERVSAILGDIFQDDEPEEESGRDAGRQPGVASQGLDTKHAAFLGELLTRPRWDETEFATLARQFRLMHAGAIETVNEWSFHRFDDTTDRRISMATRSIRMSQLNLRN